jgi:transposase
LGAARRARSGGGLRNGASAISGPKLQGGDRHSQRIEAHAELILSALAAKSDITLSELRGRLRERGVAVGTLWRFVKRRKITRKKSRRMPPNGAAAR